MNFDATEKIRQLLKERNWSVYRLAERADIPQSTLANLFHRNNQPSLTTLSTICDAFGITLSQFFAEADDSTLTDQQAELLSVWSQLNKEQREKTLEFLKTML